MHISEGVLSPEVLACGAALAACGLAMGLRGLKDGRLMTAGLLSAAFFVGSLVHVPLGPGNVHLLLGGITGMLLGWAAFPAIFAALLLQAVLFQFGGLTVLGVNTFTMALPPVLCHYAFRSWLGSNTFRSRLGAFLCGFLSVAGSCVLTAAALACTDEGFIPSAGILLAAHVPVMVIEGLISAFLLIFLAKVRPELLDFAKPKAPLSAVSAPTDRA
ncbi:MAG: cobalt transporter CbiM [Desulfovibrionaceae bacterium]|nr:cobalt transporter CbiM [Desulfovibrionaceae bacterium]